MTPLAKLLEAALFASGRPIPIEELAALDPDAAPAALAMALDEIREHYDVEGHGVELQEIGGGWQILTRAEYTEAIERAQLAARPARLSGAALETLAIIAYRQPIGRAEIEEIRGVQTAAGTLDVLLKTGWIRPRGRRKAPGRPITYGTTEDFLSNFGLEEVGDLPGLEELKGAGLIEGSMPTGFGVPVPSDDTTLRDDEDPLEPGDLDLALAPSAEPEASAAEPAAASEPPEGDKDGG